MSVTYRVTYRNGYVVSSRNSQNIRCAPLRRLPSSKVFFVPCDCILQMKGRLKIHWTKSLWGSTSELGWEVRPYCSSPRRVRCKSGIMFRTACSRVRKCCSLSTVFFCSYLEKRVPWRNSKDSLSRWSNRDPICYGTCAGQGSRWSGYSGLFEPTKMTATTLQRYYKVVAVYDKIIENEATHANWLLFCRHVGYILLIPVMQRYRFGCLSRQNGYLCCLYYRGAFYEHL